MPQIPSRDTTKSLSPFQLLALVVSICFVLFLVIVIAASDPGNSPRTVTPAPKTYGLDLNDPDPTLREVKRRIVHCANWAGLSSLASGQQSYSQQRTYQECLDSTR